MNKTGIWYLLLAQCNHTHSVHMKGLLEWRNPVGFLNGILFAYLPMYFCIATSFLLLFLLWTFFVIKYRGNLLGLQHVVTLAIIIALAENAMWAFNFIDYDLNGKIVDVINMVCASLTAGKFTIIRLAILLVSLGHSIVVPSLEIKTKLFATLMTLFYFAAATMCTYVWVMSNVNFKFPELLEIITLTSYILINFIYVLWVVISLSRQYKTLYDAHQYEKLSNYKKLVAFLVFFFIISVVVFFCQVASYVLKLRDQYWQVWWIWDAYWEFGYFFVLLLIAGLWWPNKNNKRYAYSTQLDTEDDFPLDDEPHLNVHLEDHDDDDNDDIGPGDQQL
uniref:GOST seven transmembrane domain-containing protein n=1 Tax=Arcella intermedia TaxID=1963864 RepID=A0A6B2L938_9EUKA